MTTIICAALLALSTAGTAIGTPAPELVEPVQALRGVATHYDAPSPRDAAAGPVLREALGSDWRGRYVTVRANGHLALVRLTDWCACADRPGGPTLIDLDLDTFARFAPLSQGVVSVVIEWERDIPHLPPTDVAP